MRRFRYAPVILGVISAATAGAIIAAGCSATSDEFGSGGNSSDATTGTGTGAGGSTATAGGGEGGGIMLPDAGSDAPPDVPMNPCGTACGPDELCDIDHLGLDDDCDGLVDEDCACAAGAAHWCFKGDPSYHNAPGCYDGTEQCDELGAWGPCLGGVHATESCFMDDVTNCHAIQAVPFEDVNLKDGTGLFSMNAVSETWTVACPAGVSPCPTVGGTNPADDYKPLQSGEYTVTYTKTISGGGTDSCTYPLFVGAPGLRVELQWEHDLGGTGVDLDLHVHKPMDTLPWGISGVEQDCTWSNCKYYHFDPPQSFSSPNWFGNGTPPTPVNWYLDPVFEKNTCYFSPRGVGQEWQLIGMGCHNPRLDLDNITCNPAVTDPNASDFCAAENVNIDFPPTDEWIRVGVHYYSSHALGYDVHPAIRVWCDGALGGELGPSGYNAPVTFTPSDGASFGGNKFWLVADVAFTQGACGVKTCVVKPLYTDPNQQTPFYTTDTNAEASFGPGYPPLP